MPFPRLESIFANKPELKFAAIVASVATTIVFSSLIWTSTSFNLDKESRDIKKTIALKIVEKPVIKPVTKTPEKIPKQKKNVLTKQVIVGQGNLYIQVGAFKKLNLANKMLHKMESVYKRAEIIKKSKLYMVWVGPVETKEEALLLDKNIRKHDGIKGFITSKK